jgi:hypothetical protein
VVSTLGFVLSCRVLPCLVVSCRGLSCHVLFQAQIPSFLNLQKVHQKLFYRLTSLFCLVFVVSCFVLLKPPSIHSSCFIVCPLGPVLPSLLLFFRLSLVIAFVSLFFFVFFLSLPFFLALLCIALPVVSFFLQRQDRDQRQDRQGTSIGPKAKSARETRTRDKRRRQGHKQRIKTKDRRQNKKRRQARGQHNVSACIILPYCLQGMGGGIHIRTRNKEKTEPTISACSHVLP